MDDATRVAILGATGHIGQALASELAPRVSLALYARRPDVARVFATTLSPVPEVHDLNDLPSRSHDAVVSCIGHGDPAAAGDPAIFDQVTRHADDLAMRYLELHDDAVLINMSSGAAYCSEFVEPARGGDLPAGCTTVDAYARAKWASEARHRACADAPIIDLRVFGFFSRYINVDSTYLMADIARALRSGRPLQTSASDFTRDYVAPADLAALVLACSAASSRNVAYDVYSAGEVRKSEILSAFAERFGLTYSVAESKGDACVSRANYYSLDRRAGETGYRPARTSIETLEEEMTALLMRVG